MGTIQMPNIWGNGAMFAFSGLDGDCHYYESLVGTLGEDGLNIKFRNGDQAFLHMDIESLVNLYYQAVVADTISAEALYKDGVKRPFDILFVAQNVVVVRGHRVKAKLVYLDDVSISEQNGVLVYQGKNNRFAVSARLTEEVNTYVLSFGEQAEDLIQTGFESDLAAIKEKRLAFYENLPRPTFKDTAEEMLYYKCVSNLRSMVYTPEYMIEHYWSTPDRYPHKAMWLWDTAYHSFGFKHLDVSLAEETIKSVLQFVREDGFLPHMITPKWQSSITQPPTLAWASLETYKTSGNKQFLADVYDSLRKYIQWDIDNRDQNGNGLPEWEVGDDPYCRCDESGMDNTPRFDEATEMDCVDFAGFLANDMHCLSKIAEILGKEEESALWADRFETIKRKINEILWDEEDQFYYDRKLCDGQFHKVKTAASFLPLVAGICSPEQAAALVRHLKDPKEFGTPFPIPTVSADDKTYPTKDMFRGTVWLNFNFLVYQGLMRYGYQAEADELMQKSVDTMKQWYLNDGVIYEFYDSTAEVAPPRLSRKDITLHPYLPEIRYQAVRDFSWGSAFTVHYLLERDKKQTDRQTKNR